jgi:glycine betaine/choline ABC-type transport system substrate-binding protein
MSRAANRQVAAKDFRHDGSREVRIRAAAVAVSALAAAGCGSSLDLAAPQPPLPVVVGAAEGAENAVLAQLYAAALRQVGTPVQVSTALGSEAAVEAALDGAQITLTPQASLALLERLEPGVRADAAKTASPSGADSASASELLFEQLAAALPDTWAVGDQTELAVLESGQHVVPVYLAGSLTTAQLRSLDVVAGDLTAADLAEMSGRSAAGADPAGLAESWLAARE